MNSSASAATPAGTEAAAPASRQIGRLSVGSWVLYDLANTAFSLGVLTLYFPKLVKDVLGYGEAADGTLGTLDALAAALIFVAAPVLGALSDQAARRLPFLVISTVLCVGATFVLGQSAIPIVFTLFVIATVCFQAGLIFYDSLLPEVSTEENRGRVGGVGVGVGYVGSLLAFGVGSLILAGRDQPTLEDYSAVFRAIAVLFLVFAIPAFLFVRERPRVAPPLSWRIVPEAFSQLAATARRARRYRGLGRFLLGRMFYADAANTLILMAVLYAEVSLGLRGVASLAVAAVSIVAAIPAGLAWGPVVDRIGPKRTLDIVLLLWMGVFAAAAAIPVLRPPVGPDLRRLDPGRRRAGRPLVRGPAAHGAHRPAPLLRPVLRAVLDGRPLRRDRRSLHVGRHRQHAWLGPAGGRDVPPAVGGHRLPGPAPGRRPAARVGAGGPAGLCRSRRLTTSRRQRRWAPRAPAGPGIGA